MITDEQKAIELIGCEGRNNCIKCGGRLSVEKGCSEFQNIMAMAQWKDEQFKEYVKSKFLQCENNTANVPLKAGLFDEIIKEILNVEP